MKQIFLTLFSLMLFTPSVFSEDVFYCIDQKNTGERGGKISSFERIGFKIKFNEDHSTLYIKDPDPTLSSPSYSCKDESIEGITKGKELTCIQNYPEPFLFLYSLPTNKYTWFRGSVSGYPSGRGDSTIVHFGTCDKF